MSKGVLDEVEAILNDPNQVKAVRLAAAARLFLEESPDTQLPRTIY